MTRHPRFFPWLGVTACVGVASLLAAQPASEPPEGFTALFNGKDFSGFRFVLREEGADPSQTWSIQEGIIVCTGKPNGYFYTEKSYTDFVIRYDWRYPKPADLKDDSLFAGNTGLLLQIRGEHKVWPTCIEVQGLNRDHGFIFGLGLDVNPAECDKEAQKKAIKPVGEWNTTEVTCQDGKITSRVNGVQICVVAVPVVEGPIGWQSEGAEVHFQNLHIKELK